MADEPKKKWIKTAIKHKGAMTEAAKREGVSNSKYVAEHEHDSGKAGKRARLAKTLMHMHKDGHSLRKKMYGKATD